MACEAPGWAESVALLCEVVVKPLGESMGEAKDMLRTDFANRLLGGGCIDTGWVHEESLFACHPEMICGRLIFAPSEAIIMCGIEQFALPHGYAFELSC